MYTVKLFERLYMFTVIFLKCLKNLFKIVVKLPCSSRLLASNFTRGENSWKLNAFCFPRQNSASYVNDISCLKVSYPFFCVYSFKDFSLMSNLICRLKCVIFNIFFEQFFFASSVSYSKSRNRDYSRWKLCCFLVNLGCFSSAPHVGLFCLIRNLVILFNNWRVALS